MTLGTSFNSFAVDVYFVTMEKNARKVSKRPGSGSLTLDHTMLDGPSSWSRCNSFSSCSNDSAVYCSSRHVQGSNFQVGKRLASERRTHLSKRNRNSSGSSISSNMSCISDKEARKASVIISNSTSEGPSSNCSHKTNVENLTPLTCSEINSSALKLQHKTLLNERLCSNEADTISPLRHNLRRNIRKKTCSCDCTATCTTVVVRRYKEVGKETVEEKTVISSTKVKTYLQKRPAEELHNTTYEKSTPSKPEVGRKRRSEVEKLYDSLHEIEWAKNFSPDNILRQINIRQAASCSVFGRSSANSMGSASEVTSPKRQNVVNNQKSTTILDKEPPQIRKSARLKSANREAKISKNYNPNKNKMSISKIIDEKQNISEVERVSSSSLFHPSVSDACSCDSKSSGRTTTSPQINSQKVSIVSSMKSVGSSEISRPDELFIVKANNQCLDDAQLSYTSDESVSAISNSSVDLTSKNVLQFNFKCQSNIGTGSTDNATEYSIAPAYYDIDEDEIHTIDACFRQVGAEVVVSTCYEECDLPRLTSVNDNYISDTICSSNEGPPVLEPCINIGKQNLHYDLHSVRANNLDKSIVNGKQNSSQELAHVKRPVKLFQLSRKVNHAHLNPRNKNNHVITYARKQILSKYKKYSHSRAKLRSLPIVSAHNFKERTIDLNQNCNLSNDRTSCPNIIVKSDQSHQNQSSMPLVSVPSPLSLKSPELKGQTVHDGMKNTSLNMYNKKLSICDFPEKMMINHSKNGSLLYHDEKRPFKPLSQIEKLTSGTSMLQHPDSCLFQHKALPSPAYSPTKSEDKNYTCEEEKGSIPRSPTFGFSCHYKTIRVNRNNNFTQVVLKVTRGKSIFLTFEALTELRDIVKRAATDSSCQVLIINGMGDTFCLGLDLKPLIGPRKNKASTEMAVAVKELIEVLSDFKKPLVAVVNGSAFGLGMTLLHHADVAIASDSATFCMPCGGLGYVPEGGATLTLPQVVGSTIAMDLLLRSRTLTAFEARDFGLVCEVLEAKRLPQELVSRVKILAENSLSALETTKAMMRMRLHLELKLVLENEVKLLPQMWLSKTCQEGIKRALLTGILSE